MFTTFDTDVENIQKLGDQPNDTDGLSADELKYLFDKAGMDLKDFINNVSLPEIFYAVDAAARGVTQEGLSGSVLNDNSVTDSKLSKTEGSEAVTTLTIRNQAVTLQKLSTQVQNLLSNLQTGLQNATRMLDQKANSSSLAKVATSGNYSDLNELPIIPTVDAVLSSTSENPVQNKAVYAALADKAEASSLSDVATSGSYNDLNDKPTIPVVDSSLDTSSSNAIQNGVVATAINTKQDKAIATTATLASGNTAWTVTVNGVTANNIVLVAPNAAGYAQWVDHRVRCSSQNTNTLGFTADTATTASITVNVVILG